MAYFRRKRRKTTCKRTGFGLQLIYFSIRYCCTAGSEHIVPESARGIWKSPNKYKVLHDLPTYMHTQVHWITPMVYLQLSTRSHGQRVLTCKIWRSSMCRAGREMFPCIEIALLLFLKKSFRVFPIPNQDISVNRIAVKNKQKTHPSKNPTQTSPEIQNQPHKTKQALIQNFLRSSN